LRGTAKNILILGGTREAADMAEKLIAEGRNVTISLAGRTREPAPLAGKVRIGGFGGAEGLASYLLENHIDQLMDMTHPFALQISKNAKAAALKTGVELVIHQRPQWEKMEGDEWIEVADIPAAIAAIPEGATVLLALGSQYIAPFSTRPDLHFIVRMVDAPPAPLSLVDYELIAAKPGSMEQEYVLQVTRKITHIVCRNSGGKGAYTKIAAARLLGIPVIIIARAEV
jgi:precorrin-6A/cobalt-precorrin-6A reductase